LYNIDYVIVGRLGSLVPASLRRMIMVSGSDIAVCARIGRRQRTTRAERLSAMRFAWLFWFLAMWVALVACFGSLIGIGTLFGHHAVAGFGAFVPVAFLGFVTVAVSANIAAVIRSLNLTDPVLTRSRKTRAVEDDTPGSSIPKPYDFWIGIVCGIIVIPLSLTILAVRSSG
jgi:hypothetical protein